jgi:hypothetical protein
MSWEFQRGTHGASRVRTSLLRTAGFDVPIGSNTLDTELPVGVIFTALVPRVSNLDNQIEASGVCISGVLQVEGKLTRKAL